MKPMMSLCIPIYNCGAYIGEALDSILAQASDQVEVVVYDGGSTDDTELILQDYLAKQPSLRYYRGAEKGGIDADLATCVGYARGRYCWLFSGDDVMRPGAIERALARLQTGEDLYICEHTICDRDMAVLRAYPVLSPNSPLNVQFSESGSRGEWFRRAVNTEAFFSFLSGLIIRREKWDSGRLIPEFDGSCWAHVARLLELMPAGLRVSYVGEVWLDQRGGNDSFRGRGLVKRYELAIEGYDRISKRFFSSDSLEALHLRRVIRFEFTLRMFLLAKLLCAERPEVESKLLLDQLLLKTHGGRSLRQLAVCSIYWATPLVAIRVARKLWMLSHPKSSLRQSER